ncbi:MAG: NAD-dependent epimerase/dehydratase family protein [Gammaproteobacteria bacterium]|nr:NAD-dependent epimerase/dehydratase family protein [Gammaproteobacteria bacterium]MCY4219395.1 NAD-dependent epimerase/dehydratase family protein [Gammaproteobacteria bacterium]MCY4273971.1 NAD-dependent epimerase/dehydratase family protein [Gammaproteobacteria bacterium]
MHVLITGAAGFIGAALCHPLLERGETVYGLDNLNNSYAVQLKKDRLKRLERFPEFQFDQIDVSNRVEVENYFHNHQFDVVIHLAALAGVRRSIENPHEYVDANLTGFVNILEQCRNHKIQHLIYASSSSVYGLNTHEPFREEQVADHPISLYGATKKANEVIAHAYSYLYQMSATGLRFFTVYGPWGRPDMAFFKFTNLILAGKKIPVYNHGNMARDFTYIDDIIDGIVGALDQPAEPDDNFDPSQPSSSSSSAPHRIYNLGSGKRIPLMNYIHTIEEELGIKAEYELLPMQSGDVISTNADLTLATQWLGQKPKTDIQTGIRRFVKWYREYYRV